MRCVYLLRPVGPSPSPRCYVGFSVSPRRRLRQHNGGRGRGGARATSRGGPWALELFVYGFPSVIAALRFEWAWQHPGRSRRLRGLGGLGGGRRGSRRGARGVGGALGRALRTLPLLLGAPPWRRLPLRLRWLRPPPLPPLRPPPPPHVVVEEGEGPGEEEEEEGEGHREEEAPPPSASCDLCGEGYEVRPPPAVGRPDPAAPRGPRPLPHLPGPLLTPKRYFL
ncbi:structure-specific endonuclease subunit SLX1-like isoform X2 [Phaenicophaeus curvirostris]|uniref:structure-specific endonuclease subunit SLX1-like isoform X2 n=1 Tax=Phaenicophaeus curvirostris TaxID=33595 RepID=UPI0037F0FDC7